jgi:hypothetical protein
MLDQTDVDIRYMYCTCRWLAASCDQLAQESDVPFAGGNRPPLLSNWNRAYTISDLSRFSSWSAYFVKLSGFLQMSDSACKYHSRLQDLPLFFSLL